MGSETTGLSSSLSSSPVTGTSQFRDLSFEAAREVGGAGCDLAVGAPRRFRLERVRNTHVFCPLVWQTNRHARTPWACPPYVLDRGAMLSIGCR